MKEKIKDLLFSLSLATRDDDWLSINDLYEQVIKLTNIVFEQQEIIDDLNSRNTVYGPSKSSPCSNHDRESFNSLAAQIKAVESDPRPYGDH